MKCGVAMLSDALSWLKKVVVFLKVEMATFIPSVQRHSGWTKQANDDVMHLYGFREADGLADKRLMRVRKVRCLRSIFCVFRLPWAMHFRLQMPGIRPPMIGIKAGETKGLEQRFQLARKTSILATSKDIRQDRTRVVIDRMPQPPLSCFLPIKLHISSTRLPQLAQSLRSSPRGLWYEAEPS